MVSTDCSEAPREARSGPISRSYLEIGSDPSVFGGDRDGHSIRYAARVPRLEDLCGVGSVRVSLERGFSFRGNTAFFVSR